MWYFLDDKLELLINKYRPVQYASVSALVFALAGGVSAFFFSWLAMLFAAGVLAVVMHIGVVCFLGPLLGLDTNELKYEDARTRVLAFLASALTTLTWWLYLVALTNLFSIKVEIYIIALAGVLVYGWGLSFVTWVARKHNTYFELIPRQLFKRN